MLEHRLIQADSPEGLARALGLKPGSINVFRRRPFSTRTQAIDYMNERLGELKHCPAIAVPMSLPRTDEYENEIRKLAELSADLKRTPKSWSSSRSRKEHKLVEHVARLSYIEEVSPERVKTWLVIRERDSNVPAHTNRPTLRRTG